MELSDIHGLFNAVLTHQITQFTTAFTIAAYIHAGRVKKEIANQFGILATSLDGVTKALKEEIVTQSAKIDGIDKRVDKLEKKS